LDGAVCPINWCVIILFDDKSDDIANGLAAVTVNVKSGKVVNVSLNRDVLISKVNEKAEEIRAFTSKYPDASVDVNRHEGDRADIIYRVERAVFVP
jgi:hypothetical protein